MKKRIAVIVTLVMSILLILFLVITSTYSVIINVINDNGEERITNDITIRDVLTDDYGNYNNTYYQVKNELNISEEEANILMESLYLNRALQVVINSIVDYKLHNGEKLSNEELYDLITNSINNDDTIEVGLKNKLIIKTNEYIDDISEYMYDILISSNGELL